MKRFEFKNVIELDNESKVGKSNGYSSEINKGWEIERQRR